MLNSRFLVLGVVAFTVLFFMLVPALPQDLDYHHFSDQVTIWGIPNFWNVFSNLPFLVVGFMGLRELTRTKHDFVIEKQAWKVLMLGVFFTGLGSAYYHWNPSNETLLWDRLPMALGFMGFFAVVIGERFGETLYRKCLWPLVSLGVSSVLYWYVTESRGVGDLRLYVLVQFLPLVLISLFIKIRPAHYSHGAYPYLTIVLYVLAKVLEHFDQAIHQYLESISGHSLKHVIAAIGCYVLIMMLKRRHPHILLQH